MKSNTLWDVYVVEYACSHEPWVGLVNGMHDEGMVDLPYSFVFAQSGNRNLLIDTGFMRSGSAEEFPLKFSVTKWVSPLRMLEALGVKPEAITDIVITHAHFDHMGAIGEFPNARIYIQKAELLCWYEAIALPERYGHLTSIIDPQNLRAALDASIEHRVTLIEGDKDDVLPGVHLRLGSGHTPGHQFVTIETAHGKRVISGDCIYTTRQLVGHRGNGVYVPLNNATGTLWEQFRTFDKIQDEVGSDSESLIIMHDVQRWNTLTTVLDVEGFLIKRVSPPSHGG